MAFRLSKFNEHYVSVVLNTLKDEEQLKRYVEYLVQNNYLPEGIAIDSETGHFLMLAPYIVRPEGMSWEYIVFAFGRALKILVSEKFKKLVIYSNLLSGLEYSEQTKYLKVIEKAFMEYGLWGLGKVSDDQFSEMQAGIPIFVLERLNTPGRS